MALPINIDDLINGRTVENERIEFKAGWNPESIIRTVCAFANDFNNWGGGYIVIGVAENNGVPVLPPVGLDINSIDRIQQELNQLCRRILPNYFPIAEPVDYQGAKILVLWCPGGCDRPYRAPDSLGNNHQYFHYIRILSSTVRATLDQEKELFALTNHIPFDDRLNRNSVLSDFDLSAIKIFLNEVKSDLEEQIAVLPVSEISRKMNIADGPDENLLPKNVGLLFFAKDVNKHFPNAKIEFFTFNDESGTDYTEQIFDGQIHNQLRDALHYFRTFVLKEKILKSSKKPESDRFFNYPFEAIEEALSNAVYHRGYDNDSTIEVRIYPSRIDIISYPGPLLPLNKEKLRNNEFDVRRYRNRRIGEFLKELRLTEGRATGIPTILYSLESNGSPTAVFETDDDRTFFKTTLLVHPSFSSREQAGEQVRIQVREQGKYLLINDLDNILTAYDLEKEQVREQVNEQVDVFVKTPGTKNRLQNLINILSLCKEPQKREIILKQLGLSNIFKNYNSNIIVLLEEGLLERTVKDKPKSPNQKYKTTQKGIKLLEIISEKK